MKFFKILLCATFVFVLAACNGKKDSVYEYPDDDPTGNKGEVGDPCMKNGDCKEGLFCIDKVCSEPSDKDDSDTNDDDADSAPDDNDNDNVDTDDTDTGKDDTDTGKDDSDSGTNDEDEPEDADSQPDEDSDTTPYNPECGNGIVEMGEECDNGLENADEPGISGITCRTNCKFASCGDGFADNGEACDDGNKYNGDYCSADCSQVTGYCGDRVIQNNEECDKAEDPYCSDDCMEITGSCGDGIVQPKEKCDNAEPGTGGGQGIGSHYCSYDCQTIIGWCGDGIVQPEVETCDDGTGENGNGTYGHCNTTCTTIVSCGDGILQPAYEKCDDGNNENNDYCSDDCQTSYGSCGDGIVQLFELCDKAHPNEGGKQGIGAYCSEDCKTILGECGDEEINGDEECDEGDKNGSMACPYGNMAGCEVCSGDCKKVAGTLRFCGDGVQQANEACDDGNNIDGDYCSANCQAVTGSCGDGTKQNNEACDDGNNIDGDYCSADCKTVTGSCGDGTKQNNEQCDKGGENGTTTECSYGNKSCTLCAADCTEFAGNPHFCGDEVKDDGENCDQGELNGSYGHCKLDCSGIGEHCGDGTVNGDEECDEGDGSNGNGKVTDCAYGETSCTLCSSDCKHFNGNTAYCGDGTKQDNEACDDGNTLDGDYCSADCQTITGSCGDGTKQGNEACDDGNNEDGDYCSRDCQNVTGKCGDGEKQTNEICDDKENNGKYKLTYPPYCNSACNGYGGYCNDGNVDSEGGEQCDEGENNGKIACEYGETSCTVCNSNCQIRNGETAYCGDGTKQDNEACDDGNTLDGDYCSYNCQTVTGYCGDGTKQDNEECDDGNNENNDYCSYNCQTVTGYCGDGIRQHNEACDNAEPGVGGGEGIGNYCSFDCQQSSGYCGDGTKQDNEACDDGNTEDNDYCSADCQAVTGSCGDGTKQGNEACDDGNTEDNDYCSADCQTATGSCGDGTTQGNETCDDGTGVNGTYNHCNGTCSGYMAKCGDKKIQKKDCGSLPTCDENTTEDCCEVFEGEEDVNETCDEGTGVNGNYGHCSNDCTYVIGCGDGYINGTEFCDNGTFNGTYGNCKQDCSAITGWCGDGIRQNEDCGGDPKCKVLVGGNEECDNGGGNIEGAANCPYGETSCSLCTKSCTVVDGKTAYCGDKKIQREDCGSLPLCDENTTEDCCEVVEGINENCDDGDENGTFGKCDDTCTETITWKCGDNIVDYDHGETCDDGTLNGQPHKCNNTCDGPAPYCGDGIVQQEICTWAPCDEENTIFCCKIVEEMHEACDHGDHNGDTGYCYNDCSGWCGDGILQKHDCDGYGSNCVVSIEVDEACDEGRDNGKTGHCNQICTGSTAVCGNGELEYGEACDDGNTADDDYCSADCQSITGECGDGIQQTNETCDEGDGNGFHGHCNLSCNGTSLCGDGELGKDEICEGSTLAVDESLQCNFLPHFTNEAAISECFNCMLVLDGCVFDSNYRSSFFETGQTSCYDNSDTITCPANKDEAFYGQEPNFKYREHDFESIENDEIIVDHNSGLMWQTATPAIYEAYTDIEGFEHVECGALTSCEYWEAPYYCEFLTLGGYDKWRLPTAAELSTITDYASATHMYSGFTNTNGSYWTKEDLLFSSTDGTLTPSTGSETANIKCVRDINSGCTSPQCMDTGLIGTTESILMFDSSDSMLIVYGEETTINFWYFADLMTGDTWENALQFCKDPNNPNGLNDMRLPTVNELISLIDRTNGGSLISGFVGKAWTSTTLNNDPTQAYVVDFSTGSVIYEPKSNNNIVICVE